MCLIFPLQHESLILTSTVFLSGEHRAGLVEGTIFPSLQLYHPVAVLSTYFLRQQMSHTTVTIKPTTTKGPQISICIQVSVKACGIAEAQ